MTVGPTGMVVRRRPIQVESEGAAAPTPNAVRGGAQLFAAGLISLGANYLFLLGAGRLLGRSDYSTLAALVGLLTVVLLPSGAVQMAYIKQYLILHRALPGWIGMLQIAPGHQLDQIGGRRIADGLGGNRPPIAHDGHAIRNREYLVHAVRDVQHRAIPIP